jgi:hypothetical protein
MALFQSIGAYTLPEKNTHFEHWNYINSFKKHNVIYLHRICYLFPIVEVVPICFSNGA